MEGRRIVLLTAFVLNCCAFLFLLISFVTPYWVISWPRVYSEFRKIGLWEACFNGYVIARDPEQKGYHGCWWILSPELEAIRDLVMPPWFVLTQVLITIALVLECVDVVLLLTLVIRTKSVDKSGMAKRRAPYNHVLATTIITIVSTVMKAIAVIVFGLAFKYDPFWMPHPELNYLHSSYGLAILSTFFTIFSIFAHIVYKNITRAEYQQPPSYHGPSKVPLHSVS